MKKFYEKPEVKEIKTILNQPMLLSGSVSVSDEPVDPEEVEF